MEGSIPAASNDIENQYIELETSMIKQLDGLSTMSPSRCIFRVPDRLRRAREEAYTPRIISIGPLHHGKEALKAMEEHKKRYLQHFLGRTTNLSLKDYIKKIKDQEAKLRSCYSETIDLKSDEFVRIILVDAIFIIEFLFRNWCPHVLDEDDCIFWKPHMKYDVWPDLLMLENQLPFFILEDLFDPNIFPSEYSNKLNGFERLSIRFLSQNFLNSEIMLSGGELDDLQTTYFHKLGEVHHFVYLLRKLYIAPRLKQPSTCKLKTLTAPTIEELHRAGVKFKVGSTKNSLDIQFVNGILEIPKMIVGRFTELILRNLVAFEQCFCEEVYISDYVSIMDEFVETPKDVKLLVAYNIVDNVIAGGDNELSTMINNLSSGVKCDPSNFYYGTLCEELNKFCSSKWHKSMANLRQNYFNTPWATISFVAALLLIILTVIQTICSISSLP